MRIAKTDIRTAAKMMASDADLCKRFGLTQEQLERWRPLIERGRAAAVIAAKHRRAMAMKAKAAPKVKAKKAAAKNKWLQ